MLWRRLCESSFVFFTLFMRAFGGVEKRRREEERRGEGRERGERADMFGLWLAGMGTTRLLRCGRRMRTGTPSSGEEVFPDH